MPIYEYACPKCGEFENRQSLNDPILKRCPTCKSKVTKLISASAFQLKGEGWYSDGYHKKAPSAASTTPAATPAASSESPTSTPAATPAASSSSSSSSSD